jgi:hypothetical protein
MGIKSAVRQNGANACQIAFTYSQSFYFFEYVRSDLPEYFFDVSQERR